jgi:hypothetical protein
MNVKVLERLEKGWIRFEWERMKPGVSAHVMWTIVDTIDRFYKNKSVKELVIVKYKRIPAYITLVRADYIPVLDWIQSEFIKLEMYEECGKIEKLKTDINEQGRRNTKVMGNTNKSKRRAKPVSGEEVENM